MDELTDTERFAELAIAEWTGVFDALTPIIGLGGIAALYQRSILLKIPEYPWLATAIDPATSGTFASLHLAYSQQQHSEAAAANRALLQALVQLLDNLIGSSLTQRLLKSIW
jgi:hypothetical protein